MEPVIIYTDGASRGNPGHAAYGVVVLDFRSETIYEISDYLGQATNNVAEYRGLLAGLEKAAALGAEEVILYADSELIIRQLLGQYQVKSEGLRPLYDEARALIARFAKFKPIHIAREANTRADSLANRAIERALAENV
ncbi:MAG: ribonuclease HI family protein [Bacillota bacterium]